LAEQLLPEVSFSENERTDDREMAPPDDELRQLKNTQAATVRAHLPLLDKMAPPSTSLWQSWKKHSTNLAEPSGRCVVL
jgi:hypothetical protein